MFKLFFIYLLLVHILGDYYFQSDSLAEEKKLSVRKLSEHGLIYTIVGMIGIIPVLHLNMILAVICLSISHFLIDLIKYYFIKFKLDGNYPPDKERFVYLLDQFLHLTCVSFIAFILALNHGSLSLLPVVAGSLKIVGISPVTLLSWITVFLIIWKPANITIKQLLCLHKPCEEESTKAGGFIGLLERLIMLVLLPIDQYAAIGLVLTAKSVARYNKISESQEFAEYYLLGTLLSTVLVIFSYLVIL